MIRHLVFWHFQALNGESKNAVLGDIRHKITDAMRAVGGAELKHFGMIRRENSCFNLVLDSVFVNHEHLTAYMHHPIHKQAVTVLRERTSEKEIIDYEYDTSA